MFQKPLFALFSLPPKSKLPNRVWRKKFWTRCWIWIGIGSLWLDPIGLNAQTLEELLLSQPAAELAAAARTDGDPHRGAAIFYARSLACSTCHNVGQGTVSIGPDLTKIDPLASDAELVESVLEPSKKISEAYATLAIRTIDGRFINGLLVGETAEKIVLRDANQPDRLVTIDRADIEDSRPTTVSIMPAGQINQLADRGQFLDLMRYLIELKEGGSDRARELQPPLDPFALQIPDTPLPWQPVVQRGEVAVEEDQKYPHAVALGFADGTAVFDALSLRIVATWQDGFVRHSPQNYFGLYWHRDGGPAASMTDSRSPLVFKLPATSKNSPSSSGDHPAAESNTWLVPEPAETSDPNTGTRFEGYQIGRSSVRLRYFLKVNDQRIHVTETVRIEARAPWQGMVREFRVEGLPVGGQVAVAIPTGDAQQFFDADEKPMRFGTTESINLPTSCVQFADHAVSYLVRASTDATNHWEKSDSAQADQVRFIVSTTSENKSAVFRVDQWSHRNAEPAGIPLESNSLFDSPPVLNDPFDAPAQPSKPLPIATGNSPQAKQPAISAARNVDEFPSTSAKFLRFTIERTNDNAEPGMDELQIYGVDPELNLALNGAASASSVITGFAIHQVAHLNDGKFGNDNSWVGGQKESGWAQIEFPEPIEMRSVVWARDQTGTCVDRLPRVYRIEVSNDGKDWRRVGDQRNRATLVDSIGAIRPLASPGYRLESIPPPFPTWRPSDIAFSDDGTLYAIAMTEGQIWRAHLPPPGHPEKIQWQRFASGLYHPIGLAIVNDRVYVTQKPELTELIDRDGDGTADQYRTVATGWGLSTGWHEYSFGLGADPDQNLWFALNTGYFWTNPGFVNPGRWRGAILRSDYGSENQTVIANGCRVPNGIAQGPDGNMFFTDNQGDWIQACKLAAVARGRFYGHPETAEDALPTGEFPDGRSAVWFPYEHCKSVSGPVCDLTKGKFGPFSNQIFVGDVGYGANAGIMRAALEKVDGEYQGACFRFIDGQPLGCERMKFGPDHQLYMTSLTSGLTRMAFDGTTPFSIKWIHIRSQGRGFKVKLTEPLAANMKLQPKDIRVDRYHYLYTGNYGSPKADEEEVAIETVELSSDRTTITLSLPVESHPIGMVYKLELGDLRSDQDQRLDHSEAWYTVQRIPEKENRE